MNSSWMWGLIQKDENNSCLEWLIFWENVFSLKELLQTFITFSTFVYDEQLFHHSRVHFVLCPLPFSLYSLAYIILKWTFLWVLSYYLSLNCQFFTGENMIVDMYFFILNIERRQNKTFSIRFFGLLSPCKSNDKNFSCLFCYAFLTHAFLLTTIHIS